MKDVGRGNFTIPKFSIKLAQTNKWSYRKIRREVAAEAIAFGGGDGKGIQQRG